MGGKRERTESRECGRKKVRMKVRKWSEKRGCQAGMQRKRKPVQGCWGKINSKLF